MPLKDLQAPEIEAAKPEETNDQCISREKKLAVLAKKRKREDEVFKPVMDLIRTNDTKEKRKLHSFKELDGDLLVIDVSEVVGSGTFGSCFSTVYRGNFGLIVKVMNTKDSSSKEMEHAEEVIHEAQVLANLGDHPCIPHLLGVCINGAPFY